MSIVTKPVGRGAPVSNHTFREGVNGELTPLMSIAGGSATITAVAVTTSPQSLNGLLTVKSGRTAVELQNLGAGIVYVGGSGVTTSTGRKVAVDEAWSPPLDENSDLYVVGSAAATLIVTQI